MAALPPEGPIEVAFAGRSNVGKSSLINALTGQKALARTSNTPMHFAPSSAEAAHRSCMPRQMPRTGCARFVITSTSAACSSLSIATAAAPTPGRMT